MLWLIAETGEHQGSLPLQGGCVLHTWLPWLPAPGFLKVASADPKCPKGLSETVDAKSKPLTLMLGLPPGDRQYLGLLRCSHTSGVDCQVSESQDLKLGLVWGLFPSLLSDHSSLDPSSLKPVGNSGNSFLQEGRIRIQTQRGDDVQA